MSVMQITRSQPDFHDAEHFFATLARHPGPAVVWYGPGQERVELSGRVLENWVAKTANMLVEECEAAPGTRICLELPVHWRSVVLALASLRTGLAQEPVQQQAPGPAGIPETAPGGLWAGFSPSPLAARAEQALLLDPGPLATAYSGPPLPEGSATVLDYCAEVRAFDDVYAPLQPLDPATALARGAATEEATAEAQEPDRGGTAPGQPTGPEDVTTLADWLEAAARQAQALGPGSAVAEEAAARLPGPAGLARWAGTMGAGRAVVLVEPSRWAQEQEQILRAEQAVRA